ncbi:MAG: helix-turn-helix domain-containing protein [Planctomycetota bacterium]|jgi:transcriptional regulator with XRE-family HTH domain
MKTQPSRRQWVARLPIVRRLRRSRRWQDLTQKDVAQLAQMPLYTVSQIERGLLGLPNQVERLERLVTALGGTMVVWLPGEPVPLLRGQPWQREDGGS